MNIKSLLLGSAAAMVAVSGAQAADAVVVEPEPVEYVRVCDAYGSGFFYIPGTETCLRFSGYVRTHYSKLNVDNETKNVDTETNRWSTRARFDIDARNETDWGTLRSLIRIQGSDIVDDGGPGAPEIDQAVISIAGFRAGISGSLFNGNFAVVNLEGVSQLFEDYRYGFSNSHVLDYTFGADGFSISVGIEDNRNSAAGAVRGADASDVSGLIKVEYSGDNFLIGGVWETAPDTSAVSNAHDVWKIYGQVDLSEFIPGGVLGGWYAEEALDVADATGTIHSRIRADSLWGIGFQMNLTDNVEFIALHVQTEEDVIGDEDATTIGLNWYPVSGLKVFGAYSFGEARGGGAIAGDSGFGGFFTAANGNVLDFDQFMIGIRRSF